MGRLIVLDTSAFCAALFEERGGDIVAPLIEGASMGCVNLTEVVHAFHKRALAPAFAQRAVERSGVVIRTVAISLAWRAGELITQAREFGLSLGDCYCLALAESLAATVYTADRAWREVTLKDVDVQVIR